jgi:uncharacterized protein
MTSHTPVTGPIAEEDRLEHIDLVRGYALLGVLLVNLHSWFRTAPQRYWAGTHPSPEPWNVATDHLTHVWFEGKSVTLFSMLFAIGLCIQRERADAKAVPWGPYAFRRLGSMLLFGALHIVLLWYGDILHTYAVVGLVTLLFLGRERRTIGLWIVVLAGGGLLYDIGRTLWAINHLPAPPPISPAGPKGLLDWADASVRGYTQTSWFAVLRYRVGDWVKITFNPGTYVFWGKSLVNFLVGLYLWKHGAIRRPKDHLPLLRRVAGWGLGLGLAMNILITFRPALRPFIRAHWSWARYVSVVLGIPHHIGVPIMALGLGAALIVLWQDPIWKERLRPLTYVGRMAFTNYITQSIICTTLFYGFGFGLYDKLSPLAGTGIVAIIYGLQIPLSRFWLTRFRYGPLEWLWRTLTYGSLQPFRRTVALAKPAESLAS